MYQAASRAVDRALAAAAEAMGDNDPDEIEEVRQQLTARLREMEAAAAHLDEDPLLQDGVKLQEAEKSLRKLGKRKTVLLQQNDVGNSPVLRTAPLAEMSAKKLRRNSGKVYYNNLQKKLRKSLMATFCEIECTFAHIFYRYFAKEKKIQFRDYPNQSCLITIGKMVRPYGLYSIKDQIVPGCRRYIQVCGAFDIEIFFKI
jgi:hypothetical protein